MFIFISVFIHIYASHTYTHTYLYTCLYIYIHIYVYIYIHTYTYIYIRIQVNSSGALPIRLRRADFLVQFSPAQRIWHCRFYDCEGCSWPGISSCADACNYRGTPGSIPGRLFFLHFCTYFALRYFHKPAGRPEVTRFEEPETVATTYRLSVSCSPLRPGSTMLTPFELVTTLVTQQPACSR